MIKILLVDDDEDEYILLKDMLTRLPDNTGQQFSLAWVVSADQALAACTREKFDVFLVDYYLGGETGLDLMREIEKRGCFGPFILLTGRGSYELDLAAMQHGVADYLLKDQLNEYLLERSIRYAMDRFEAQAVLEKRVQERTRELAEKNNALQEEIERRDQAEKALLQAKDELETRVVERTADLQAANRRLETVLLSLPVSLVIADRDGNIIDYNQAFLRLWQPKEKPAEHIEDWMKFQAWCSDTGEPMRLFDWPLVQAIREGQSSFNRMIDIISGEGEQKTILQSAVPILGPDGQVQGGVAVSQDITLQRRLEREANASASEARERADALEGLHKATTALLSTLEMDELLGQILDAAQGAIPAAQTSVLHLLTPGTGELKVRAFRGLQDRRIHSIRMIGDQSYPARVLRDRRPMLVVDTAANGYSESGSDERNPVRSMILAPLVYGTEMLGTISLTSPNPGAFNQNDLRLLASFAATTTAAMQNAMLHAEVKHLAISDPLTGQLNRRAFFERGQWEIERYKRSGSPLVAVMVDLDRFKQINDLYGHSTGDQVLRILAARIRHVIRETDLFGRYGGDEFALLLPDTDLESATRTATRILEEISHTPWMTSSGPLYISISIGVAAAQERHHILEDLLGEADLALYQAKAAGRNRVQVSTT